MVYYDFIRIIKNILYYLMKIFKYLTVCLIAFCFIAFLLFLISSNYKVSAVSDAQTYGFEYETSVDYASTKIFNTDVFYGVHNLSLRVPTYIYNFFKTRIDNFCVSNNCTPNQLHYVMIKLRVAGKNRWYYYIVPKNELDSNTPIDFTFLYFIDSGGNMKTNYSSFGTGIQGYADVSDGLTFTESSFSSYDNYYVNYNGYTYDDVLYDYWVYGWNAPIISNRDSLALKWYGVTDLQKFYFYDTSATPTPTPTATPVPFTAPYLMPNPNQPNSPITSGEFTFWGVYPGSLSEDDDILLTFYDTTYGLDTSNIGWQTLLNKESIFFQYTNLEETEFRYIITARFLPFWQVVNGKSYLAQLSYFHNGQDEYISYTWTMSLTAEQQQTQEDITQQEINQGINDINNFLSDTTVNENAFDMPEVNIEDTYFVNITESIYDAYRTIFTSDDAVSFEFNIPFTNQKITIPANYIEEHCPLVIKNLIRMVYWYLISRFILKNILRTIDSLRQGDFFLKSESNIKTEIL